MQKSSDTVVTQLILTLVYREEFQSVAVSRLVSGSYQSDAGCPWILLESFEHTSRSFCPSQTMIKEV